jgi:hypothetical protein
MRLKLVPVGVLAALALSAGSASAAVPSPGWTIDSRATPSSFSASQNEGCLKNLEVEPPPCDAYHVHVTNAGSQPATERNPVTGEPTPVVVSTTLPEGLTVRRVELNRLGRESDSRGISELDLNRLSGDSLCAVSARSVVCHYPGLFAGALPALGPEEELQMTVYVTVNEGASGALANTAAVSGGGALSVSSAEETTPVSSIAPSFGPANFNFYIDGVDGARDTQAGDHPYAVTTTIDLDSIVEDPSSKTVGPAISGPQDVKDIVVDLPLGFVGSTLAAPECSLQQLSSSQHCPLATQVGHITTEPVTVEAVDSPIWNLVPESGVPAEFGYVDRLHNSHVFYVHVVPSPAGYVLQVTSPDIPQIILSHIVVTFFGDPAERDGTSGAQVPFFTNPAGCKAGPLVATVHMDSWQNPGAYNADGSPDSGDPAWVGTESVSPPVTGCNALAFTPELKAQPTTNAADTPSGLEFELKLPQDEETDTNATAPLKRVVVRLPEGFTVDPSAGDGLAACSEAQIGWLGGTARNFSPAAPECPEASKIGSLELSTPLLPHELTGALYLARQEENPFNTLLAAYVVVNDPATGVLIKIAGEFLPDPRTGQLTAVFDENPQLPFSDLKLHFFGGPRAELATPKGCGTFTTNSELTPWSAPDSGLPATPFDGFVIDEGCAGGFSPSFIAGSTNLQAGAFSPFVASFSRSDTDQELQSLSVSLPPGLLAKVAGVPLCGEADANAGTCGEASQVGTVQVGVGPGPNPLFVGGKVYLTGPYNGGPYGLSVVVPAVAGPFNFGTVVVRQSIRIDPTDAHVTDVSDPFPTIIDGIPLRLRRVDVHLERPGFTFNPTSCEHKAFAGSLTSTAPGSPVQLNGSIGYATQAGPGSALPAPFQVTNCATLKFAPKFTVSTSGKTSKANGASLTVKLTYPNAPQGSQANIARVKVDLPKQLPSRLTTLQKACTAAQFNANPAGCPPASIVGHAKAVTPILPVPLEGPAYFVSHGGEAFPSLIMVLQGDGVTLDLVGTTFISKTGITSSTFKTVPDAPVGSFELTLPQGKYSALTALGNLCTTKPAMPTEFLAQNGATIHQSTPVGVTGCAKKKSLTRAQKLAAALKLCHKDHNHAKRTKCEKAAHKKYGPATKTRKKRKK